MSKNKELWNYSLNEKVWVGKYKNSQNISHWHNECELLFVNEGQLEVMVDGNLYTLNKNDSFLIIVTVCGITYSCSGLAIG